MVSETGLRVQVNERCGGWKAQGFLKALLLDSSSLKPTSELEAGLSGEATT